MKISKDNVSTINKVKNNSNNDLKNSQLIPFTGHIIGPVLTLDEYVIFRKIL